MPQIATACWNVIARTEDAVLAQRVYRTKEEAVAPLAQLLARANLRSLTIRAVRCPSANQQPRETASLDAFLRPN